MLDCILLHVIQVEDQISYCQMMHVAQNTELFFFLF